MIARFEAGDWVCLEDTGDRGQFRRYLVAHGGQGMCEVDVGGQAHIVREYLLAHTELPPEAELNIPLRDYLPGSAVYDLRVLTQLWCNPDCV
jgi:hypothetical protein